LSGVFNEEEFLEDLFKQPPLHIEARRPEVGSYRTDNSKGIWGEIGISILVAGV
jgi:hypothetical protein